MHREPGHEHRYDTGHIVMTEHGAGTIVGIYTGLYDDWGNLQPVVYTVEIGERQVPIDVREDEILGFCERVEKRGQPEMLPIDILREKGL